MKRMTPEDAETYLGIQHDGGLSPCPPAAVAVCSYFPKDRRSYLSPIPFRGIEESAVERIKAIADSIAGMSLVKEDSGYLRFRVKSPFFKQLDDVEFLVDEGSHLVHFRSSARQGYWDLGRNRRRMKLFKTTFAKLLD